MSGVLPGRLTLRKIGTPRAEVVRHGRTVVAGAETGAETGAGVGAVGGGGEWDGAGVRPGPAGPALQDDRESQGEDDSDEDDQGA